MLSLASDGLPAWPHSGSRAVDPRDSTPTETGAGNRGKLPPRSPPSPDRAVMKWEIDINTTLCRTAVIATNCCTDFLRIAMVTRGGNPHHRVGRILRFP